MKTSIRNWAEDDRPREKLLTKGSHVLSDAELLAILIGTGTPKNSALDLARAIINNSSHSLFQVSRMSVNELKEIDGIKNAKATRLKAAFELMARIDSEPREEKTNIRSSADAYRLARPFLKDLSHEEFYVAYLNRANKVISLEMISKGGLSGTVADGKVIFKKALDHQSSGLILFHNHPSGQLKPSESDRRLTKQLSEFGKMIDLQILDHIILAGDNYFSFADEGLMS